ncbi:TIGR03032 family protein [Romeria aff. gracilis LEGE 07310]|uniref:TIGR03032 family protein n=1 Tax=Vasconcelosia minhoensis LEGE 07310 TaxID=915328 RepID=A0A8J7DBU9_9CYAN|nr:TIGR03032 family protein [Romeria gracilis]MBE9076943.1 TIGR03032 family protein [Romeria aff. gracilis LEGE 07310]
MSLPASISAGASNPRLEITGSRQFTAWLAEQPLSLAFTTYQAGKMFWLGLQPDGRLSVFERTFERCMGLCIQDSTLWLSTLYQLWRFENTLPAGQNYQGYDALYVPQMSYVTGDLDIHDVVIAQAPGKSDRASASTEHENPVFVNTLFSCLAQPSATHSFVPVWQPPFISKLAAEDRCHLNGLALRDGQPRYVTAISQSDVADGWRDQRVDGGCVVDIESNEVIATGLSMPHSPRWYRGQLWLLNSGRGEFGYVDVATGRFEAVTFCPGYLRGLAFAGDFAVVGLSEPRHNKSFQGLPLDDALTAKGATPRCGLGVIDLRSGDLVHTLRIEGVIAELYDVAVIPGVRRPMAIGFRNDEIRRVLSVGDSPG